MNLQPEMFFSRWHLIAVVLIVIAWIGLIVGKYERKTVIRSGLSAAVIFYAFITIPVIMFSSQDQKIEEQMLAHLEDNVQLIQADYPNEPNIVAAAAGTSRYKRDRYDLYVYAGNYSSDKPFEGDLTLTLLDSSGDVLETIEIENIKLEPGEKKRVRKTIIYEDMDSYNYRFH